MGRVLSLLVLAILLSSRQALPCVISGFSPTQASAGASVTLYGSGFTGATSVLFEQQNDGIVLSASFSVISDTEIAAVVPSFGARYYGCYITVITNSDLTVTLDPTATIVGNGDSATSAGSDLAYIESGGLLTNNRSGSDVYYIKDGGTLTGKGGGGGNVAYAEPGATISLPGVTVISVPEIDPSPVTSLFQYVVPVPALTTGSASGVSSSDATLSGAIIPGGVRANAYFQYGPTLAYGSQTSSQKIVPSLRTTTISAALTGLTPGTLYHYCITAINTTGTSYGSDATFETSSLSGGLPGVFNFPVTGLTTDSATANAHVNPNGTSTSVYFEYGLTGAYGSLSATQSVGSGASDVPVQSLFANLLPNTTYHYSVVATNSVGTTVGADQAFQSGIVGIDGFSPPAAPAGTSLTLSGVGFTGATSVAFQQSGISTNASFVVLSDTQMAVTVPSLGASTQSCYITVVTNAGLTVTLNPTATVVPSGSSITTAGAGITYIEADGEASNNGTGDNIYYLKNGGLLDGIAGGANVAYVEPGASVSMNGVAEVSVPQIDQSPVSALFQFVPSGPGVITGSATNIEFSDATANGTVVPEGGQRATAYVQYGTTTSYGSQTAYQAVGVGNSAIPIAIQLTGLAPGTTYNFRLVATNNGVTNYGADETFSTASLAAGLPGLINDPTSGVSVNAANLNAVVDPNGTAANVYFEYGLTAAYGSNTPTQPIGSGTDDVSIQASLGNLIPNTTYHYCAVATNSVGTTTGSDQTFQTAPIGIFSFSPAQAAPGATLTLSGVGFTGATSVIFDQLGNLTSASFVVLSDTQMAVTVPNCGGRSGGYYITVSTSAGLTVTVDPSAAVVENGVSVNSSASAVFYVEGGGVASNNGSGSQTYYIKSGGLLNGRGGGGGNIAYIEPGATVALSGVTTTSVPDIGQSPVPVLFQFIAPAHALTGVASNIATTAAIASGTANAEGTDTSACILYGTESSSGSQSLALPTGPGTSLSGASANVSANTVTYQSQTPSVDIGSGTSDVPLAVNLNGLTSNTAYHFCVAVTNAAGTTYGADQQFTTNPAPYDLWNESQFSTAQLANPNVSGDTIAPSGDGVPNLMKYALGMTATADSIVGLPISGTAVINGTNCLTFTYTKMDAATDITYHPEWSSDLSTWSTTGFTEVILSDNGTSQQVQDSIPITGTQPIFFHLRVTTP